MAIDFSALDKKVNFSELNAQIKEAEENGGTGNYEELPKGEYIVRIENMEIGETKDGRPMLKVMARVQEAVTEDFEDDNICDNSNEPAINFFKNYKGKKKPCIFMNRVLYGTKNDGNMIASAVGWVNSLEPQDTTAVFESYSQFNDCVLDIFEEIEDAVEFHVVYDPDAFNSISVVATYDI